VNPRVCETLLRPGQNCTLRVRFAPDAVGAYSGKLTIEDNSSLSPQHVALLGTGVPGTLAFVPRPLAFGKVKVNTTSTPKFLKMTNLTGAVASVISVAPSTGFAVSNDLCTGATLTYNQSCTIDVAFNPTAAVHVIGKLTVTTDSTKDQGVQLEGTGVP